VALEEVNALGKREFTARLGGVFENSPWIAERAWERRPFRSLEELHLAMLDAVRNATQEEKRNLIRAHPELAGDEALTPSSSSEQGRLGFHALSKQERGEMNELNRRYREKFGFPCIVALALHADRASVLREMRRRLANDAPSELASALEQIGHITRGRLEKLLRG
jgi:2-oxo-4-hydroxy-4-carboxy-5-ureidoimidazoline decarboxylase